MFTVFLFVYSRPATLALPSQSLFHTFALAAPVAATPGGAWGQISVRTKIRNYFPKPRETKRLRNHGFAKRMSTPEGRRVIWRRILKGKWVLAHT